MKQKTLLALAGLTVVGTASAQSSVTVFGVLDAAVSRYSVDSGFYSRSPAVTAPALVPNGVSRSQTAMSSGGYEGGRVGFRGTEDLGGGLAAGFWLEAGIRADDGSGMSGFNRRSTVSLSGRWGEVRAGRDYTPTFRNDVLADPFWVNGVGANLIAITGVNLTLKRGPGSASSSTDNYAYTSNSVAYFLPPNIGGWYGQVQYAFPENVGSSGAAGGSSQKGRFEGARLGYASGPLDLAAAYSESVAADGVVNGAAARTRIKVFNVVGIYDFGALKLFGQLSRTEDAPSGAVAASAGHGRYDGALLAVTVPAGVGTVRASFARVGFRSDAPSRGDAQVRKLALGYVHPLSKRTVLYSAVSRINIRNGENNPAVMGVTTGGSAAFLSTGDGVSGFAPRRATGLDVGIRHAF